MQQEKFFDPERWAIVPASDYALGPSNGHACHTLSEAMKIFAAELPARLSNTMRRQKELEDLKLFIAGTKSAVVLKQTTAVATVQNEVATLVGLLREYESIMLNRIKAQTAEFQTALTERALLVEDTSRKLEQCISKMSIEDVAGNEAVAATLKPATIETILNGMITSDHLLQESASLFSNFPEDLSFQFERAKDSTLTCSKLVTLQTTRGELKGVPPLIVTRDILDRNAINTSSDGNGTNADGSPGRGKDRGPSDMGIRRLLQLPGSEHVQGLFPRTAFGQQLTKRAMSLEEFHKLLHAGCIRTLGNQCGTLAVNKSDFISPLVEFPLKQGRDTFKVFGLCTARTAEGKVSNLAQIPLHIAKEAKGVTKLETFRTINQKFPILWFDFGSSTVVRVERYVLFHGHEQMHCAMRSWRLIGTNELPFPAGIVASSNDETLQKISRDSRNAVQQRHEKAETPDNAIPDHVSLSVLDVRSREASLGPSPFGAAMFECCGPNPQDPLSPGNPPPSPFKNINSSNSSGVLGSPLGLNGSAGDFSSSPSARSQRDFYRYIGIQITAPGAAGGYHFELSGVEFYGTMMTMSGQ
jgi:hypothetical protein